MATPAEIQAVMDAAGTGKVANIARSGHASATIDEHYVVGVTEPYAGRSRWVATTAADSAAVQAAALLAGLTA